MQLRAAFRLGSTRGWPGGAKTLPHERFTATPMPINCSTNHRNMGPVLIPRMRFPKSSKLARLACTC